MEFRIISVSFAESGRKTVFFSGVRIMAYPFGAGQFLKKDFWWILEFQRSLL